MTLDSRSKGKFQSGFSAQEIGQFWFLHAINSSLGPFRHIFFSKRGHPEELFLELLRLGEHFVLFPWIPSPAIFPSITTWRSMCALPKWRSTFTTISNSWRLPIAFSFRFNPWPITSGKAPLRTNGVWTAPAG